MFNGNLLTTPQPQSADCNLSITNHLPVKAGMKTPGASGFLYGSAPQFQFSVAALAYLPADLRTHGLAAHQRILRPLR